MKIIYTCLFALLGFGVFAQQSGPLEFLPNDTLYASLDTSTSEYVINSVLKNVSVNSLKVKWKRTFLQLPNDCSSYICDELCYSPEINTSPKELNMTPGKEVKFSIHFTNECCGIGNNGSITKLTFHPSSDLSTTLLTTYLYCNGTTSTSELAKETIKVGPNPTTEYIILTDRDDRVTQMSVYSMTGRLVKSFRVNGENEFYVGDINQGLYFVKLMDKNNKTLKTVKLQKLNP